MTNIVKTGSKELEDKWTNSFCVNSKHYLQDNLSQILFFFLILFLNFTKLY